ncbi:uncharacterized protein At2g24330-like isoform X2 [Andrographis paniculata]|nr:uncharacterized protein At2g24330-like isoform X2 [Andrographis paniculata]XP_051152523.1 uncharacterized protein At2g24330-like isoform X2 [Andrographis paniculata]
MAEESKNDAAESATPTDNEIKTKKKKKGIFSRLWNAIFRVHGDDFEKRLEHISKEEAAVLARITKRSHSSRRMTKHVIIFSLLFEVIAVGYAVLSTRSLDLNWKTRALRVFPMFLLPVLSFVSYTVMRSFTRMRDKKDHKTLEKLRAERQAKIDELKERTNYYITQQLIQRYDSDPAAKAAAATVLASKLGADTGLKVYFEDESAMSAPIGKSNDAEFARTGGLRNRKSPLPQSRASGMEMGSMNHLDGGMLHSEFEGADLSQRHPRVVEHHTQTGLGSTNEGWIARLAALLVGEDPTQSYALICGNCHMHNGLAKKEDFPYITYYCPHCKALNQPKQSAGHAPGSDPPGMTLSSVADAVAAEADIGGSTEDKAPDLSDSTTTGEKVPSPDGSNGTTTPVAAT